MYFFISSLNESNSSLDIPLPTIAEIFISISLFNSAFRPKISAKGTEVPLKSFFSDPLAGASFLNSSTTAPNSSGGSLLNSTTSGLIVTLLNSRAPVTTIVTAPPALTVISSAPGLQGYVTPAEADAVRASDRRVLEVTGVDDFDTAELRRPVHEERRRGECHER